MTHRIAKASVCTILSLSLILAGCSTSWIKVALADLPIITQVALNIASIVAAAQSKGQANPAVANQVQSISNQVKSDLTLVENLVTVYQSAPAANRASILGQIDTALTDAQTNLNAILSAVHVNNAALQSTIAAAVGIAVSTIVSIQSLIPARSGGPAPAPASASARSAHSAVTARPAAPPPPASHLKRELNSVFVANGFPEAQVR